MVKQRWNISYNKSQFVSDVSVICVKLAACPIQQVYFNHTHRYHTIYGSEWGPRECRHLFHFSMFVYAIIKSQLSVILIKYVIFYSFWQNVLLPCFSLRLYRMFKNFPLLSPLYLLHGLIISKQSSQTFHLLTFLSWEWMLCNDLYAGPSGYIHIRTA